MFNELIGLPEEPPKQASTINETQSNSGDKKVMKWCVDSTFKKLQEKLNMPAGESHFVCRYGFLQPLISDPEEWAVEHVQIWLQWAVRHFNLVRIQLANWSINGRELFAMKRDQFKDKVPVDQNDIFWTHLELLRKCKFVGKRLKSKQKIVLQKNLVAEISPIFLLCDAQG
jgi:GA-binding protein transcription factor, alpha